MWGQSYGCTLTSETLFLMMHSPKRTTGDVQTLFRYTYWANTLVLEAMEDVDAVPERAVELFSHLLRAQDLWYGRVQGSDLADLSLWAKESLAACAERHEASDRRWQTLLEGLTSEALDRPIAYTNTKGIAYETPLRDILMHVVNHSTHHRAQIAYVLREAGIAPPPTDYIYYLREQ